MMSRSTLLRWSTAALLAGLLLRVVFILHHPRWTGDTQVYGDLAENLLTHHVFGFSSGAVSSSNVSSGTVQPTLIRLPGYPLFLAACFALFGHANYLAAVCVQVALDLLGCVLLGLLAARLYSPRAGLVALWLAALCPFTANYTAAVLTETVSIFCVTLALFALERWSTHYHHQNLSSRPESARTGAPIGRSLPEWGGLPDAAERPPHSAQTRTPSDPTQHQSLSSRPESAFSADAAERPPHFAQTRTSSDPTQHQSLSSRPESAFSADAAERPPHFARSRTPSALIWPLVIGAALSFAVLVRPDQGLLAAAVIPAMLWRAFTTPAHTLRSRLQPAVLASLVVALPLLLWGVRNWHVFHVIQPLAPRYANDPDETVPFGFQRWYRTWGVEFQSTYDTYWAYDGAPLDLAALPNRAFDSPRQRAATAAVIARYNVQLNPTPPLDAVFAQLAAARVAAHPLRYYLVLPVARLANMWLRPRTELLPVPIVWWTFADPAASAFAFFFALVNAAYLALAIRGFIRNRCNDRTLLIAMLAFVALRCALLLTLDNSEPRYTLECFPILILLSSPLTPHNPSNPNNPNN